MLQLWKTWPYKKWLQIADSLFAMCGKEGGCDSDCEIIKCVLCGDSGHKASEKISAQSGKKEISINKSMTLIKMSRRDVLDNYDK